MSGVKGKSGGPRANAGGARPGAGRKPMPPVLFKQPRDPHSDMPASLWLMLQIVDAEDIDLRIRLDAAKALAPYEAVKKGETGKKEAKAEAAKLIGRGKFAPSAPPRTG